MKIKLKKKAGFTLVELLVVLTVIILITTIGLRFYDQFLVQSRDKQRKVDLNRFQIGLEQYRSQYGAYPCGDTCKIINGVQYSIDCNTDDNTRYFTYGDQSGGGQYWDLANNQELYPNSSNGANYDLAKAITRKKFNGFLNGGNCCDNTVGLYSGSVNYPDQYGSYGYPAPTSSTDGLNWGLYYAGYLATSTPADPLQGQGLLGSHAGFLPNTSNNPQTPTHFFYCYATPADGRKSYKLFAQLEADATSLMHETSSPNGYGLCREWYEVGSSDYPNTGWHPGYLWDNTASNLPNPGIYWDTETGTKTGPVAGAQYTWQCTP